MWEPAFGAGFQAPRADQESQATDYSRSSSALRFHSKAANSAQFRRNRVFSIPGEPNMSFFRKPLKMHPSSDSCAEPINQSSTRPNLMQISTGVLCSLHPELMKCVYVRLLREQGLEYPQIYHSMTKGTSRRRTRRVIVTPRNKVRHELCSEQFRASLHLCSGK